MSRSEPAWVSHVGALVSVFLPENFPRCLTWEEYVTAVCVTTSASAQAPLSTQDYHATSLCFFRAAAGAGGPNSQASQSTHLQRDLLRVRKTVRVAWENYTATPRVQKKPATRVHPTFWASNLECLKQMLTYFWRPDKNRKAVTKQHPVPENKNSFGFFRRRFKKHPWRSSSSWQTGCWDRAALHSILSQPIASTSPTGFWILFATVPRWFDSNWLLVT